MTAIYECPDHDKAAQDIHKRYKDTSLVIFKVRQNVKRALNLTLKKTLVPSYPFFFTINFHGLLYCFQEHQNRPQLQNYLSFGPSRKTMEYSSNGNDAVVVKKREKSCERKVVTRNLPLKENSACSIIQRKLYFRRFGYVAKFIRTCTVMQMYSNSNTPLLSAVGFSVCINVSVDSRI